MDEEFLYSQPATEELARRFTPLGKEFHRILKDERGLYSFMELGAMLQLKFLNLLAFEELIPDFIEFLREALPQKSAYCEQLEEAHGALQVFLSTRNKSVMRATNSILECARSWEIPFDNAQERQTMDHFYGLYVAKPSAKAGSGLLIAGEALYSRLKQDTIPAGFDDEQELRVYLDELEVALLLAGHLEGSTA